MILLISAVALIVVTVAFTFFLGGSNPPAMTDADSPVKHLEERRAAIYENLRDLQFEFRVGKLSEPDYQQTKLGLQRELAGVLAEMERVSGTAPAPAAAAPSEPVAQAAAATAPAPVPAADPVFTCGHCGAQFSSPMKFCGECGQEMTGKASA